MDLVAWAQMIALHDCSARRWEPKRLRFRLFSIPAVLVTTGRRRILRFSDRHPRAGLAALALARLRPLALAPG
jgi:hypothetical protein